MQASDSLSPTEVKKKTYWALFLVIAACAAPVILSYLTYYVIKPQVRNNYGDLIDPRINQVAVIVANLRLDHVVGEIGQNHGSRTGGDHEEQGPVSLFFHLGG